MDNALGNIAGDLKDFRSEITDAQEQLKRIRMDIDAPFAKEAALAD